MALVLALMSEWVIFWPCDRPEVAVLTKTSYSGRTMENIVYCRFWCFGRKACSVRPLESRDGRVCENEKVEQKQLAKGNFTLCISFCACLISCDGWNNTWLSDVEIGPKSVKNISFPWAQYICRPSSCNPRPLREHPDMMSASEGEGVMEK